MERKTPEPISDDIGNLKDAPRKKRERFEDRYTRGAAEIDGLNLLELKTHRDGLVDWLEKNDFLLGEPDVKASDNKRKYFIELRRRVILPLLHHSKVRGKQINVLLHNQTSASRAARFIDVAAEILPMRLFQKIYGLTLAGQENEAQRGAEVERFLKECEREAGRDDEKQEEKDSGPGS